MTNEQIEQLARDILHTLAHVSGEEQRQAVVAAIISDRQQQGVARRDVLAFRKRGLEAKLSDDRLATPERSKLGRELAKVEKFLTDV